MSRRRWIALAVWVLLAIALVVVVVIFAASIVRHAENWFGFRQGDGNGPAYLFWSGPGSDLAYISLLVAVIAGYRKINCKRSWCPFIGQYDFTNPETGVTRKLCAVHHPDVHERTLSKEHISRIHEYREKHHLHLGDKIGKG